MSVKIEDSFGFYAILTDPIRGYGYVANVLAELSVPFVQLREKKKSEFEVLKIAEKLGKIFEATDTKFIINDYVNIVPDCGADGVHLGQNDMSFEEARDILGADKIIGLSTHNPNQTESANHLSPDYIGVGPVYKTPTKDIPDPVLGIDTMAEMVGISNQPAVCIGGISFDRLPDVINGGAKNFSMVRPVCSSEDPRREIKKILEIYNSIKR